MSASIACILITAGKRTALVDERVIPSMLNQGFEKRVVVGEHHAGPGYDYLHVPDLTKSTNDALVKRDVGTLFASCDYVVYLCDDHRLHQDFGAQLRALSGATWDVLVPSRWTKHPVAGMVQIPMGEAEGYCAGHGGVFRRWVVEARPWAAMPHHRNWDVLASQAQRELGARFVVVPQLAIEDLEPEAEPWR